jgi:hypothetical protein
VAGIEPPEVTVEMSFVDDLDLDSLSAIEIAVQTEASSAWKNAHRAAITEWSATW